MGVDANQDVIEGLVAGTLCVPSAFLATSHGVCPLLDDIFWNSSGIYRVPLAVVVQSTVNAYLS